MMEVAACLGIRRGYLRALSFAGSLILLARPQTGTNE